jgi:hypothetical protein
MHPLRTDSIDGCGHPLGFMVAPGRRAATVANAAPAREVFRVEARKIDDHQKELLVTEGEGGATWRLVSDEGPNLRGTDLAPFPLAFFNAAMHADYANRLLHLAGAHGIEVDIERIAILNRYQFAGSFVKGTGQGSAEPVDVKIALRSSASPERIARLLDAALAASPVHALFASPLRDTFALYVNGRRVPVQRVAASAGGDQLDPFKAHRAAPVPLGGAGALADTIDVLPPDPAAVAKVIPGEGRIPIPIAGSAALADARGLVATTVVPPTLGNRFRIFCDERPDAQQAPSALACAAAAIAFCYMTQFTRYIEYRHHAVRAIRFVQRLPFALYGSAADWSLRGAVEPVDTHVFLHAEEPDEVMQNLLEVAENTCYLHAALRSTLPGRVTAELNGTPLPVPA